MNELSSIIGHQDILAYLQRLLEVDNLPHCMGFVGPEHVGKRTVADWLIERVKAQYPPTTVRVISSWNEEEHKHENIAIDDIRDAVTGSGYTQEHGVWQIVLVDGADYLSEQASNALLKAMEEPAARILFLFIAHRIDRVLPTIRSRAFLLRFRSVPLNTLQEGLTARDVDVSKNRLKQSHGLPGLILGGYFDTASFEAKHFTVPLHDQFAMAAAFTTADFLSVEIALSDMARSAIHTQDYHAFIHRSQSYATMNMVSRFSSVTGAAEHLFL